VTSGFAAGLAWDVPELSDDGFLPHAASPQTHSAQISSAHNSFFKSVSSDRGYLAGVSP